MKHSVLISCANLLPAPVKTGVSLFLIYRPICTIFVKSRPACVILGQKGRFWAIMVSLIWSSIHADIVCCSTMFFRRFTDCGIRLAEPAHKVQLTELSRPQIDYDQPALTASHDDEETWFVNSNAPRAIHRRELFDGYRCSAIFGDKLM